MPRRYRFVTADVFTEDLFGGNPLAVFPEANGLTDAEMQRIAREFNLSETTFVLPPQDPAHTCAMRIFTPGTELPFAGHPTVGTAIVLAEAGRLAPGASQMVIEEKVGPVPVTLSSGRATFSIPRLPVRSAAPCAAADLARVLGLPTDAIAGAMPPAVYNAGVPFCFVALRDAAALAAIRLDHAAWSALLAGTDAPHVFAYTLADWRNGDEARARMFAPAMGIAEDPATGGAAAAFAGLLADLQQPADGTRRWIIRQGEEMGRPSRIALEGDFAGGKLVAARVGGAAVIVSRGEFLLP